MNDYFSGSSIANDSGSKIRKVLLALVFLGIDLLLIAGLSYLILPVAFWYLGKVPAKGVDLYLSVSYVSQLLEHFTLRFNGWKDIWFTGVPLAKDYPSFYFYLMLPFAKFWGLVEGIQIFAVVGLGTFALFSYLLYCQLAKERGIAFLLTLVTVFSANLYRSLVWAGGIPFWTTQAFFPLVMFLLVKYGCSGNKRWLYLGGLASGLGMMGHPQSFLNIILPSSALLLLLWQPGQARFSFLGRLKDIVIFLVLSFLVALPVIGELFPITSLLAIIQLLLAPFRVAVVKQPPSSTGGSGSAESLAAIEEWARAQFNYVWQDSEPLLWVVLAIGAGLYGSLFFFQSRKKVSLAGFVSFSAIAAFTLALVYLYSRGIDLYVAGWYKVFWPVLVGMGMLTAFFWGQVWGVVEERLKNKMVFWGMRLVFGLGLVILSLGSFASRSAPLIERLEKIGNHSSAYPEILNAQTSSEELKKLAEKLKPKLMSDDSHDYRLYVIDATVNIWWGALEDVPLTRGYVDPPLSTAERWGLFWLDAALGPTNADPGKSSLIVDWKVPEEVADNNLRFLLDWYATRYLEGNHVSAASANFAANIISEKLIEEKETITTAGGVINRYQPNEQWDEKSQQSLNFYRIKKELVSPILTSSEVFPILFVGDDIGYDTLVRYLGEMNLGPRKVVLAKGPKYLDRLSYNDLNNFPALILYRYDYRNHDKVWGLIGRYVEKGGRVYIDTGAEVKESDTSKLPVDFAKELPNIFPFKKAVREDLGQRWEPTVGEHPALLGVNFLGFSPLVFDEEPWNISHPISKEDLRKETTVILSHKKIPVVVERTLEKGKVIWSGFNLPYHAIRDYNPEEGKFFQNILEQLVEIKENPVLTTGKWLSPGKRIIEVGGGRSVIFKEQAFAGWKASLGGKSLPIYKAGPASPGFIYVRLPEKAAGQLVFEYVGSWKGKIYFLISLLTIIFIADALIGGRIFFVLLKKISAPLRKRTGKWWDREDEY